VQELGYEPTLSGLSSLNGSMVAASCRRTLTTLIQVRGAVEAMEKLGCFTMFQWGILHLEYPDKQQTSSWLLHV
jgi:hypothetical protein